MKVLYAVQGTGNGHVSRALEIVPLLKSMANVDVLVSGTEHEVKLPFKVNHSFAGYGFVFGTNGGIDYAKTFWDNSFITLFKEILRAPVREYDLVINDFEPVTAYACKLRGTPCVSLSHQAGVIHPKSPRVEKKDRFAWFVLNNYAPAKLRYGFHFKAYGKRVFTPVIRKLIRDVEPTNGNHITVYLPAYGKEELLDVLGTFTGVQWHVFSKRVNRLETERNVSFYPVDQEKFISSLASGSGFLCGAGFEGPAEALYLGKKVAVVPMEGQYEQHLNAAAAAEFGVPIIQKLDKVSIPILEKWLKKPQPKPIKFPDETQEILAYVLKEAQTRFDIAN